MDEFSAVAPLIAQRAHQRSASLDSRRRFPGMGAGRRGDDRLRGPFSVRLHEIGYNGPVTLEPHMDCSAEATRRCKQDG
jgi:hypothetical protein